MDNSDNLPAGERDGDGAGDPDTILECTSVTKRFGDFVAIDDVSLSVRTSEVVCIVGASGSGKSTFLRLINGLERFDQGKIVFDGIKLPGKRRDVERIRREVEAGPIWRRWRRPDWF